MSKLKGVALAAFLMASACVRPHVTRIPLYPNPRPEGFRDLTEHQKTMRAIYNELNGVELHPEEDERFPSPLPLPASSPVEVPHAANPWFRLRIGIEKKPPKPVTPEPQLPGLKTREPQQPRLR